MKLTTNFLYFKLILLIFLANTGFAGERTIYVSPNGDNQNAGNSIEKPLKDIQFALDKIPDLKKAGEGTIQIRLMEGDYYLTNPLEIRPEHSGTETSPVIVSSQPGSKVAISGGKKLEGWKKLKNGLWTVDILEVASGQWKFRQLYVNDELRTRARKPNNGFLIVKGMPEGTPKTVGYHTDCQSFEFAKGDIDPKWKNMGDVEVVVYHFWTDSHLPIQSIDEKTNIVTFKHKAGKVFTDDFSENGARYLVENVFEELDGPGEWYLDRKTGKCYYFPFPEEKIETTRFSAPVAPQLVNMAGKPEDAQWVSNIRFENLEFSYTNWELPEGNSNDRQGSASVPAAVSLTGVQASVFSQCTFSKLGTWAFELNEGCSDNTFSYNEIGHVAAGGFRVNGGTYTDHPFLRTKKNRIIDNHIHHYGEVYPSAVGILLQHTEGNQVAHNRIHDGYYTGISIGWHWGYQRSISRDNLVEFNHIYNIGQGLLSDMGAIYTLGLSPGTVIRNNLIHDVDANHYGGWGIYHDEGSSHILVENNIVYNTKFAAFNIHFCKEVTVRNNIFALGKLQQMNRTRSEPHKSVFFEQNIIYWKEGKLFDGKWEDSPHPFYFNPKNEAGTREVSETFDADFNLYFNPEKNLDEINFNGNTWNEWNKAGKDVHSVFADPKFVDAENFDFRLHPESPAFDLGFNPIDLSEVGPRKKTGAHSL
jgi:hypothetical protein